VTVVDTVVVQGQGGGGGRDDGAASLVPISAMLLSLIVFIFVL